MPRPMTKQAFRERLHEMRDAVGLAKFSAPPAQQPGIEAVDPVDIHNLMDLVEEIIRRQRALREEMPVSRLEELNARYVLPASVKTKSKPEAKI